ncbi:MAG: hypothetical protein AYK18_16630 [Theionarchaea archaeon DG-70]|nr:MAG: hypothetical protein AYK18_16630 [Theionarchaea archaeon DG-70]
METHQHPWLTHNQLEILPSGSIENQKGEKRERRKDVRSISIPGRFIPIYIMESQELKGWVCAN